MVANHSEDSESHILALVCFIYHDGHGNSCWSMDKANGPTNPGMTQTGKETFGVAIGSNQLISHAHFRVGHIISIGIICDPGNTLYASERCGGSLVNTSGRDVLQKFLPQHFFRRQVMVEAG